jgi:signal transduction histidine kinase
MQNREAELEAEIAALQDELAETNRGVVALYAELDDKAAQLREVADLKSKFLSYMSHEFRTPLASMRSITRILLDELDGPLTEEQKQQVKLVDHSAVELTDMVNDLLDLAKIDAGRITISPKWFELVHVFSALRGIFKPIVMNDEVSLTFVEPTNAERLYTDDTKLSQILRNFISNALKFTPRGEVTVRAEGNRDMIRFSVTDTGIGIPEDHIPRLFHDFTQVDSRLQNKYRGTGLGLSVSRKFAQLLGGDVYVTSRLGEGSVFAVVIPKLLPGYAAEGNVVTEMGTQSDVH